MGFNEHFRIQKDINESIELFGKVKVWPAMEQTSSENFAYDTEHRKSREES